MVATLQVQPLSRSRSVSRRLRDLAIFLRPPVVLLSALVLAVTLVAAIFSSWIAPHDPLEVSPADSLADLGTPGHLLGTDLLGRDTLSRLVYGSRLAWTVGGSVAGGSLVVGCVLGLLGGFYGGPLDAVFSRIVDALIAIPGLLLALVFAAIFGPGTWTAVIALILSFAPVVARVVRSSVLVERNLDYVSASRGLGTREIRILLRHIFPNVLGPMLVVATLTASRSIIVESSLSYLGVGTQPPAASWGLMIRDGQQVFLFKPLVLLVPAITLSVTVVAMNILSDAISDRLDPAGRVNARRRDASQ